MSIRLKYAFDKHSVYSCHLTWAVDVFNQTSTTRRKQLPAENHLFTSSVGLSRKDKGVKGESVPEFECTSEGPLTGLMAID